MPVTQQIVNVWRRVPLRAQGYIFVALPLLSVVVSAILALIGNYQRAGIEAALQRHVQFVNTSNDVLTSMINAETGMRGYLLTERDEFLQPYDAASQSIPAAITRLHALSESEPGDTPRSEKLNQLAQLQPLIDQQMADLAWQKQVVGTSSTLNPELYTHLAYGKRLMDSIRAKLAVMQAEEAQLMTERLQEINAIRQRDYLAIFLVLCVGLGSRVVAWYLFNTGITYRIEQLVGNVRSLRQGRVSAFSVSGKQDTLGDLERELALLNQEVVEPSRGGQPAQPMTPTQSV